MKPIPDAKLEELLDTALAEAPLRDRVEQQGIDRGELLDELRVQREHLVTAVPESAARFDQADRASTAAVAYLPARGRSWLAGVVVSLLVVGVGFWASQVMELSGFLTVAVAVAVVGVAFVARRLHQLEPDDLERAVSTARDVAEREFDRDLLEGAVKPLVRKTINDSESFPDRFGTLVDKPDAKGLVEMEAPHFVATSAQARLRRLLALPNATIGIAGPRGAGKTTLIRSVCPTRGKLTETELCVLIPAPVEYGARDFVLHLFAELCRLVLGDYDVDRMRRTPAPRFAPAGVSARRVLAVIGLLAIPVGVAMVLIGAGMVDVALDGLVISGAGLVVAGIGLLLAVERSGRFHPGTGSGIDLALTDASGPAFEGAALEQWSDVRAVAADRLKELWFQQSFSRGWSGSLSLPVSAETGIERGEELARQQLTLPDIVRELRDFIEALPRGMRVIVGIDELDKLPTAEAVERFLNDIKMLFGHPETFFLLSLSEDAMSRFRRRGLPLRDVFDSSLDDVVRVEPLTDRESVELLEARVVGVPVPFLLLCHAMSGGLPRDTIRAARELVWLALDTPQVDHLGGLARALIRRDLRLKLEALRIALAREPDEGTDDALAWLESFPCWAGLDAPTLLAQRDRPRPPSAVGKPSGEQLAELIVYCAFCATVLEYFGDWDQREAAAIADGWPTGTAERLAAVRRAFAQGPAAALAALQVLRSELLLDDAVPPLGAGEVTS